MSLFISARARQSGFGWALVALSKHVEGLDIIHDLYGTVCNAKTHAIHQKPQDYEGIQHKDWCPIPHTHEFGWQKWTVGTSLWGSVYP